MSVMLIFQIVICVRIEFDSHFFFVLGKSTFFNILTKSEAPAENFPFCTIDPNESKLIKFNICLHFSITVYYIEHILNICFILLGRVPVPDERFDYLCDFYKPAR